MPTSMKTFRIKAARIDDELKPKSDLTSAFSTYASIPGRIGGGGMNTEIQQSQRTFP